MACVQKRRFVIESFIGLCVGCVMSVVVSLLICIAFVIIYLTITDKSDN